jgi:multiple sugar transport system ATP-binding protein
MAAIAIRNLNKAFGPVQVLTNIDIDIGSGEFVVLVGPSGCGKSTLLRVIAGLDFADEGAIFIDGHDVTELPAKSRDVAMVFQSYALYPHMTVAENMAFSLRVRRADPRLIDERVKAAARTLNLNDYLARKPAELSGGQRQRVAMGRAIVRDPKLFLFDEPLSNLDAKLRVSMRSEIKALHNRLKTTTIYVTHDQIEALTMADRIVVLRAGRIEQIGSPLDLYDEPANTFVAEFIGSPAMNLISAKLEGGGRSGRVRFEDGSELPLALPAAEGARRSVIIGVRPEHLRLSEAGTGLTGRVMLVEPTGAQVQIVADTAVGPLTALLNERIMPKIGSAVGFSPIAGSVHLFDGDTGQRLDIH